MAKKDKQVEPIEAEEPKEKVADPEISIPSGPKWVKVTKEQLNKLQADARLVGYNPETSEALIK